MWKLHLRLSANGKACVNRPAPGLQAGLGKTRRPELTERGWERGHGRQAEAHGESSWIGHCTLKTAHQPRLDHPGMSPLEVAGAPPGQVSYLDALAV